MTITRTVASIWLAVWLATLTPHALAQLPDGVPSMPPETDSTDGKTPSAETSSVEPVRAGDAQPGVRLARIDGFDDDAAYVRAMSERATALADSAERTVDPIAKAGLLLAAANTILSCQLEPLCTKTIVNLPHDADDPDDAPATTSLDRAGELINQARQVVDGLGDGGGDALSTAIAETRDRIEVLQAFAQTLRASLIQLDDPEAESSVRQAASQLSVLLEHADPSVAAAAAFWQAHLRSRDPDLTRALSMLGRALADPAPRALPYALFGRILRCRLLARQGGYATSLALLTQMEERSAEWLRDDVSRADALRLIVWEELGILADWRDHLSSPDRSDEWDWCRRREETLRADHFAGESNTLLRLRPPVPMIAHASDAPDNPIPREPTAP